MQTILGYMRRAIQEYDLIQSDDHICVGISGGKDSVALLCGLARLRRFFERPYSLYAVTLDPCFSGIQTDYSPIQALCEKLEVPYVIKRTEIGEIVFDTRQESNPCSLCARMRRGLLHDTAKSLGCNVIALGHHYNDAIETFMMNLFYEGRIGCFSPKSYLSRKNLWMIRPLVLLEEKEILRVVRREQLPVVKSRCPVDGDTSREKMKRYLQDMEKQYPGIQKRIFGAMRRANIDGWGVSSFSSSL